MTEFSDLYSKEVICLRDGRRLGYVNNARLELPEGRICALIIPGPCRFFGLWGRRDDYVIPWNCIKRIGPDIILVDITPEECRVPRQRPALSL